ncbi:hypothetical protein NDU88_007086 [Pleurodeles waltl]|uniref:Uncharacterized protein n=1 Tax=Pleurodeles waltl TaxID=8319 RepID=A0AAV7NV80_PLEWA|nr:hypothetical protein NDU88_007086 [Pleurodeles waltl]
MLIFVHLLEIAAEARREPTRVHGSCRMRGTTSGPVLNSAYRKQQISASGTLGVKQLGGARASIQRTRKVTKGSKRSPWGQKT